MTAFSDLRDLVYAITNRPDLVAQTGVALRRAIIKEHSARDYARDIVVASATLTQANPNLFRYTIDTTGGSTIWYPRLRKINILREIPTTLNPAYYTNVGFWGEVEFKELNPDNIWDGYGRERVNYYYRHGVLIDLVASRQVDIVGCTYYALPILTSEAAYTDWMADLYPYALADHAAAQIFRLIGKSDEYKMFTDNIQENRMDIVRSEIGEEG